MIAHKPSMNRTKTPLLRPAALAIALALMLLAGCAQEASNAAPHADAGADRVVLLGQAVLLDGGNSMDPDGDALSYAWAFGAQPQGSAATLSSPSKAQTKFTPDLAGVYRVELTVADGHGHQAVDTVVVEAGEKPVADAGDDAVVMVGAVVQLDGRGSGSGSGQTLTYAWRLVHAPPGSAAALDDASSPTPHFTADVAGEYRVELTVANGSATSSDDVVIRADREPVAEAGDDQTVALDSEVWLDAAGSHDPDGDDLTYAWSFVARPSGSTSSLQAASSAYAHFLADAAGSYIVELTVDDGVATASDRATITVEPPEGSSGSYLYVSPSGDDANPGTEASPLATVGAALEKAEASAVVDHIELAAGTYEEAFGQAIHGDLTIVGPADAGTVATLLASGAESPLFTVTAGAYLTLQRTRLQTKEQAVQVESGGQLGVVDAACMATTCVDSNGTVSVQRTKLTAAQEGSGRGVNAAGEDSAVVLQDCTIEGFEAGVVASYLSTPLSVARSVFQGNVAGFEALYSKGVRIADSTFSGNGTGSGAGAGIALIATTDVDISDTDIVQSTGYGFVAGLGSAAVLRNVLVSGSQADGIRIDPVASMSGTIVTLLNSKVTDNDGDGVTVGGAATWLYLGTPTEVGGNDLSNNRGYALHDGRPDGAAGSIVVNGTHMAVPDAPEGTYRGPDFEGFGFRIENANEIVVY